MPGTFLGQKSAGVAEGTFSMMDMPSPCSSPTNVVPTKLFIGGISRRTTTKQLRDHFSKSGRVLDCVAMRTPDGRPRGFGYVTLDSPAAADRFLMEPQMIDDRIVDMKRAVPEALTPKEVSGQPMMSMADYSNPMSMQALYSQPGMFYPWPDHSAFYCDAGFGGLGMPDMSLQQPAEQAMDYGATGPLLPDCVDLLTGSLLAGCGYPGMQEALAQPASQAPPALENEAPALKFPLAEVTNILGQSPLLISSKKPAAVIEQPLGPKPKTQPVHIDTGLDGGSPCFIYEDPEPAQAESPASTGEPTSPAGEADVSPQVESPESPLEPEAITAEEAALLGLPSIGSAQHASGDCRRCNFFAKGRCRNGLDCVFCHLPHDRRKLSRQEKREQQASRQTLQGDVSDSGSEAEQVGPLLSTTAVAAPPGLSLGTDVQPELSAAPAALPAGLRPPGLPAPLAASARPFFPWEGMGAGLLATSPTSSAGGTFLLSTTPNASTVQAPGVLVNNFVKETRSVETQTDDDFSCPHCEDCSKMALASACECLPVEVAPAPVTPSSSKPSQLPYSKAAAWGGC